MKISKFIKVLLATALLFTMTVNAYAADAPLKADAQATTIACKAEAEASGCRDLVAGKGLLQCMSIYKIEHREFKFSDGCSEAMKRMKAASVR